MAKLSPEGGTESPQIGANPDPGGHHRAQVCAYRLEHRAECRLDRSRHGPSDPIRLRLRLLDQRHLIGRRSPVLLSLDGGDVIGGEDLAARVPTATSSGVEVDGAALRRGGHREAISS
jgi:hypothetical protein